MFHLLEPARGVIVGERQGEIVHVLGECIESRASNEHLASVVCWIIRITNDWRVCPAHRRLNNIEVHIKQLLYLLNYLMCILVILLAKWEYSEERHSDWGQDRLKTSFDSVDWYHWRHARSKCGYSEVWYCCWSSWRKPSCHCKWSDQSLQVSQHKCPPAFHLELVSCVFDSASYSADSDWSVCLIVFIVVVS